MRARATVASQLVPFIAISASRPAKHGRPKSFRDIIDPDTGKRITVPCTRTGPSTIENMLKMKSITPTQKVTADHLAELYRAATQDLKAIDYSKVRVDGGLRDFGPSISRLEARKTLDKARKYLGYRVFEIVLCVVCDQLTLKETAGHCIRSSCATKTLDDMKAHVSCTIPDALDDLQALFKVDLSTDTEALFDDWFKARQDNKQHLEQVS